MNIYICIYCVCVFLYIYIFFFWISVPEKALKARLELIHYLTSPISSRLSPKLSLLRKLCSSSLPLFLSSVFYFFLSSNHTAHFNVAYDLPWQRVSSSICADGGWGVGGASEGSLVASNNCWIRRQHNTAQATEDATEARHKQHP